MAYGAHLRAVKLLPQEGETYVLAESEARIGKEHSMRQRRLRTWGRENGGGRNARHIKVCFILTGEGKSHSATLSYKFDRATLRVARRRESRYLLRTNIKNTDPAKLWEFYLQLNEVKQAFKELKGELALRPISHCFGSARKAGWIGAFKLLRRRVVGVDVCGFFERLPALGRVAGRWSGGGWQDDQLERYSQSRCEVGLGCNDLRMFW